MRNDLPKGWDREAMLERVRERGTAILSRRRIQLAAVTTATAALGLVVVLVTLGATSPARRPMTVAASPSDTATPTLQPSPTTTPVPSADRCRNSHDPACGEFRWASTPSNAPMTMTITPSATSVPAGTTVKFAVRMQDDSLARPQVIYKAYGEDMIEVTEASCGAPAGPYDRYGTWDVPPKGDQDATDALRYRYAKPGRYTVTFKAKSDMCNEYDPYVSVAETSTVITVT